MSLSAGRVGVRADQVDAHGRVISPSFLNEIMEDLPEWTDLPVRVNGTEQLIPSNPSVPVTSPILTDIDYPDVRRNNQYFTYRESPTSVDGLAKIKSIKGNTLVWNQLYPNPTTFSSSASFGFNNGQTFYQNHKYLFNLKGNLINASADNIALWFYGRSNNASAFTNRILIGFTSAIWTCTATATSNGTVSTSAENNVWIYFANRSNANITSLNVIDLTQIFGAGNEPTTVDEFTSLFPLPYYAYDSGSLLSFNGSGIKTVGKNLLNLRETQTVSGITFTNDNGVITINGTATATAYFTTNIGLRNGSYFIGAFNEEINTGVHVAIRNESGAYPLDMTMNAKNRVGYLDNDIGRFLIYVNSGTTLNNFVLKPMISFESSESFEPYTENTTNLPTLTYFPTGMKSAGSVYDELLPTKAITRVGAVDLGSAEWMYNGSRFNATISNLSQEDKRLKGLCAKYPTFNGSVADAPDKSLIFSNTTNAIYIKDSSYSDPATFKSAMSGVYLYYELATPVELPTLDFGE